MRLILTIGLALTASLVACGPPPEPVELPEVGITSIPVRPGELEGLFGLIHVAPAIVDAPLVGKKDGGGETWYLVDRTWDPASESYTQVTTPCGGIVYEVAGNTAFVSTDARRKTAPSTTHTVTIVDHKGTYVLDGHLELWGIDFGDEDPYETPFPATKKEAAESPHKERIFDAEGDGNPGITANVSGLVDGDQFFIQRRTVDMNGVSLGPDRLVGLQLTRLEQFTLGATNLFLEGQASIEPTPEPLKSWFEELRLEDGADCDAVQAAIDGGYLGGTRPPF